MSYQDEYVLFDNDLNKIREAIMQKNIVISLLGIGQQDTPAMGVKVGSGDAYANDVYRTYPSATNVAISAADVNYPRKDLVCINTAGTIVSSGADALCKGVAEAASPSGKTGPKTKTPKPPDIPTGYLLLAEVWVAANVTVIYNADITDRRMLMPQTFPYNLGAWRSRAFFYAGSIRYRNGYFTFDLANVCRVATTLAVGFTVTSASWVSQIRRGFGVYQWKLYIANGETGKTFYFGFADAGACGWSGAYFGMYPTTKSLTSHNGYTSEQTITGWTPTTEATLKIEWTSTSVKFYVDGVLKTTHTSNVPQTPIPAFSELDHNAKDTNYSAYSETWMRDFERVA